MRMPGLFRRRELYRESRTHGALKGKATICQQGKMAYSASTWESATQARALRDLMAIRALRGA